VPVIYFVKRVCQQICDYEYTFIEIAKKTESKYQKVKTIKIGMIFKAIFISNLSFNKAFWRFDHEGFME